MIKTNEHLLTYTYEVYEPEGWSIRDTGLDLGTIALIRQRAARIGIEESVDYRFRIDYGQPARQ